MLYKSLPQKIQKEEKVFIFNFKLKDLIFH